MLARTWHTAAVSMCKDQPGDKRTCLLLGPISQTGRDERRKPINILREIDRNITFRRGRDARLQTACLLADRTRLDRPGVGLPHRRRSMQSFLRGFRSGRSVPVGKTFLHYQVTLLLCCGNAFQQYPMMPDARTSGRRVPVTVADTTDTGRIPPQDAERC